MKKFQQLELPLWKSLQSAQAMPQTADLKLLWDEMVQAVEVLEPRLAMEVSAEAILKMGGVLLEKSSQLDELMRVRLGKDPVMKTNAFARFVRQSMHVNLDQFIEEDERKEHDYPDDREMVSVLEVVTKEEALEFAHERERSEAEAQEMIAHLEYDEDVTAWATVIRCYLRQKQVPSASIMQLEYETDLSLVKLWLAGLLGGFEIQQSGEFYDLERVVVVNV